MVDVIPSSALCVAALLLITGCAERDDAVESSYLDPATTPTAYISCMEEQGISLISAHRGGKHTGFPENAIESLEAAITYGPMLVEVDVRQTADGHLVLLHDDTLERTTTGEGNLLDFTLEELRDVRLKDGDGEITAFSIPTLDRVLEWADDRAILQLDIKQGVGFDRVAQVVSEAGAVDSALLIAYGFEDALTALAVDSTLSFSLTINGAEDLEALDAAGIPRSQVVAWTGVVQVDADAPDVWQMLDSLGMASSAGAIFGLEDHIAETGDPQPYADIANGGVDVIAAGNYRLAYDTVAPGQDMHAAIEACAGQ